MSLVSKSAPTELAKDGSELDMMFDRKPFEDANADGALRFFPPNPAGPDTEHTYNQNPFSGSKLYRVTSLQFFLNQPILLEDTANNINVQDYRTALKRAVVTLYKNGGQKEVLTRPLSRHMHLNDIRVHTRQIDEDGTGGGTAERYLMQTNFDMSPLESYFNLDTANQFELKVHFEDSSVFASQSDFDSSSQGGGIHGLEAAVQYFRMMDR